jgi:hypothetical protein
MNTRRGAAFAALTIAALAAAPAIAMAQRPNPVRTGVYRGAVTPLVRGASSQNAIAFAVSGNRITQFALKYHLSCTDGVDRTVDIIYNPPMTETGGQEVSLRQVTSRSPGFGIQRFDNQTFTGGSPIDTITSGGLLVDGQFSTAPTRSDPRRTEITGNVVLWGRSSTNAFCRALPTPRSSFADYTATWSGSSPNITRR